MRKTLIIVVLLFQLVNLTGCKKVFLPQRKEIDFLQLVQVVGIDKNPGGAEECTVTIASKRLSAEGQGSEGSSGNSGGGSKGSPKAFVLSAQGNTIFEAVRNLQTHSNKTIFWGHSDYYLIGEEAAKDNIAKFIDFVTRDHELRIEAKVYIVKGSTAKELIEEFNKGELYIHDKLDSLGRNFQLLSIAEELEVRKLMRFIDMHNQSARIPAIYLIERNTEKDKSIMDIEIAGYAVISGLKLAGYIERDISRGVNLITNNFKSSTVVVKDISGQTASLEIVQSNTEIIPHFRGDELEKVTIKTKVISNLPEVQSQTNFVKENSIPYMESQQSEILKNEMESVIEKVAKLKSDCLGICDAISLRKPIKWRKIEHIWSQIAPELKIDIQVESKIQRSFELKEPSGIRRKE